ncbi:hypothetical protein NKH77_04340 [Streptomyces sp. M19]
MRLTLLPGDRARLHSSTSLLIIDGWSSGVFYRDLFALVSDYNAVLAPLEVDFGDYATALRELPAPTSGGGTATGGGSGWTASRCRPRCRWWPTRRGPPDADGHAAGRARRGRWAAARALRRARRHAVGGDVRRVLRGRRARLRAPALPAQHPPAEPAAAPPGRAPAGGRLLLHRAAAGRTAEAPVFADLAAAAQRDIGDALAHNLVTGVEVSRELGRRRGTHRPVAPSSSSPRWAWTPRSAARSPTRRAAGHHRPAQPPPAAAHPQVALEVRLFELRGELVVVFSLVEELFAAADVDRMFREVMRTVESLVTEDGWTARSGSRRPSTLRRPRTPRSAGCPPVRRGGRRRERSPGGRAGTGRGRPLGAAAGPPGGGPGGGLLHPRRRLADGRTHAGLLARDGVARSPAPLPGPPTVAGLAAAARTPDRT